VKTAKDLIIPFSWEDRRPILLERFFYVPAKFSYVPEIIPFFQVQKPVMIEYCSGNGQWIGERAKQNPHLNWLAVEKKFERARQIWLLSYRENLPNLVVACSEGLIFTRYYAPKAAEIFINFPDPWPKLRHAKHRIVRREFLNELSKIIDSGGKATCVTDDPGYAKEMVQQFQSCPDWKFLFNLNEWPEYGKSFFNDLWKKRGRKINYLCHEKI
jgi:tRNA (guanine-N7-)-methyltransferase